MGSSYALFGYPTFTQGLILGQFSVLLCLALLIKYLFLAPTESPFETSSYHTKVDRDPSREPIYLAENTKEKDLNALPESAEWLSILLRQVVDAYRSKLRDHVSGVEGNEIARQKIEHYANSIRPTGFLDRIKIHSFDLGSSAPRISNARIDREGTAGTVSNTVFDLHYIDTVSLSLSTSYLFNYPTPSFARLPVSLTISLSRFQSSITLIPPASSSPVLTLSISPDFTLDLATVSLMGSRAKLANVPKLHELIQHQVRRILVSRAIWKIPLPGLALVESQPVNTGPVLTD